MQQEHAPTKENTKVVVRSLPASLSSDGFWKLIEDGVAEKIVYWYYVAGQTGLKKNINSRAYLYFKSHDNVCEFNEKFNGHIFLNSKGVEERAQVEYAPYQRLPKPKKRPDLRMGSIIEDPDYLSFVEKLKEQPASLPSAEVQLDRRLAEEKEKIAAAGGVVPAIVTPLMEDIRAKRAARNAPRSILQAPKRRGGGNTANHAGTADKKRGNKDEKEKRDLKANTKAPRDRNARRRKDRDERKKKKQDSTPNDYVHSNNNEHENNVQPADEHGTRTPSQQPRVAQQRSSQYPDEKSKPSRTGLWMVRNRMEPGTITIQTRGAGVNTKGVGVDQLQNPLYMAPHPSQPPLSQLQSAQAERSYEVGATDPNNRNRGRRESKKIYTPKHVTQAQPQAHKQ